MKNFLFIIIVPFILMVLYQPLNNKPSEVMIKKDAKKLAEYYRQRVIKGESMASLATLYSEDPGSASNGGQYKNVTKGMFVPEFETVAFNLKPNEISEVFETQFGFHFIQLISRKNDVLDLRHLLITRD
ncbi:MAG: peptidylprolyl isomerase [Bacteroidia bacterium]|nr:peptidylprolyl isomerase [Bacteroidia bacterium]